MFTPPVSNGTQQPVLSPGHRRSASSKSSLDFDGLMKIMLQELKYQDPLKPQDSSQMVQNFMQMATIQNNIESRDHQKAIVQKLDSLIDTLSEQSGLLSHHNQGQHSILDELKSIKNQQLSAYNPSPTCISSLDQSLEQLKQSLCALKH